VSDEYATSLRIAATPEEVFPYLTDPVLIVRWMGEWADLQPKPGGAFVIDINGVPIRGEYVLVEPPHRVVFTWGVAGNDALPPGSTTVDITLTAAGEGTVLELVHRDLPEEELPKHEVGWAHFLPRLATAAVGCDPGADSWGQT
jgi:uncharacterized protein YndB with AHSA1/START domain